MKAPCLDNPVPVGLDIARPVNCANGFHANRAEDGINVVKLLVSLVETVSVIAHGITSIFFPA